MTIWRLVKIALWAVLALILIQFAISNRTPIMVGIWPIPYFLEIPAYSLLFAGIFIGLFMAALVTGWLRLQGFTKRRQLERQTKQMAADLTTSQELAHSAVQKNAVNQSKEQ